MIADTEKNMKLDNELLSQKYSFYFSSGKNTNNWKS